MARTNSDRHLEPVAIVGVDTVARKAEGLTRHRTILSIDTSFPVGQSYITPAQGEQWYIDYIDMSWRLSARIPFNDDNLAIEPVPGQVVIGGTGPVVLNGSQLDIFGNTSIDGTLGVGSIVLRDDDGHLEQSSDGGESWDPIGTGGPGGGEGGGPSDIDDITGLQEALDDKVDKRPPIAPATRTKITYNADGLVTAGAHAGISDITGLATALANLETGQVALNAQNLYNQVPSNLLGQVPASSISSITPNLLDNPAFREEIGGAGVWSHDTSDGHSPDGCSSAVANSTNKVLVSNLIEVSANQSLAVGTWVKYVGLTAVPGANSLRVSVIGYYGPNLVPVSINMIASILSPSGSTSAPLDNDFVKISGTYLVPAGVDRVAVELRVTAAVNTGTVKFDDAYLYKEGLIPQAMVAGLPAKLAETVTLTDNQELSNKFLNPSNAAVLVDSSLQLLNAADPSKVAKFSTAGISTGTTRTYALPNIDALVGTSTAGLTLWTGTAAAYAAISPKSATTLYFVRP